MFDNEPIHASHPTTTRSKKPQSTLEALDDLSYKLYRQNKILEDIAKSLEVIARGR